MIGELCLGAGLLLWIWCLRDASAEPTAKPVPPKPIRREDCLHLDVDGNLFLPTEEELDAHQASRKVGEPPFTAAPVELVQKESFEVFCATELGITFRE